MRSVMARVGMLGLASVLGACGDDGFSPTPETVAGSSTHWHDIHGNVGRRNHRPSGPGRDGHGHVGR